MREISQTCSLTMAWTNRERERKLKYIVFLNGDLITGDFSSNVCLSFRFPTLVLVQVSEVALVRPRLFKIYFLGGVFYRVIFSFHAHPRIYIHAPSLGFPNTNSEYDGMFCVGLGDRRYVIIVCESQPI